MKLSDILLIIHESKNKSEKDYKTMLNCMIIKTTKYKNLWKFQNVWSELYILKRTQN